MVHFSSYAQVLIGALPVGFAASSTEWEGVPEDEIPAYARPETAANDSAGDRFVPLVNS